MGIAEAHIKCKGVLRGKKISQGQCCEFVSRQGDCRYKAVTTQPMYEWMQLIQKLLSIIFAYWKAH